MIKLRQVIAILFICIGFVVFGQHTVSATKYYPGHGCGWRTADGSKINIHRVNSGHDRWVALSHDMFKKGYKLGDVIIVKSKNPHLNGEWIVRDKMGPRARNRIDFLMTRTNSKHFANCKVVIKKKINAYSQHMSNTKNNKALT